MIERRERSLRRDGLLFGVGLAGLIGVEVAVAPGPVAVADGVVREFLFGCSAGILCSGIFRATNKQALVSTLALGVGFALGAVIEIL